MEQRDLDDIARFLGLVGKATLYEYFAFSPEAAAVDVAEAIQKRRAWAQGQQANPKYREEAIWLIKNVARCRRALLEDAEAYRASIERVEDQRADALRLAVRVALAGGPLNSEQAAAFQELGARLGLSSQAIDATVATVVAEDAAAAAQLPSASGEPALVDHYAVLEAHPDADLNSLEGAYRQRYRWARQLNDARRADLIYARLDEAWAVLKDPATRARYDEQRRKLAPAAVTPMGPTLGTHGGEPERELEVAAVRRIQFAEGEAPEPIAAESETGPPGAFPAPPEGLAGQTLGVDSGNRAAMPRRSARLELDGPEDLLLQVGRKARIHPLIVRKAGSGPLPGRVFVDREWVRVSPSRLDPDAESQVVQIEVLPQEMPRRKAVALVTVLSDDGQRRSVTLQAQRSNPLPWVAAAAALLALAAGLVLWLQQPPVDTAPPAPVSPILLVMVDPPAGRVFVGSRLVNSNGNALVSSDLTAGDSTLVRVELNGFKPWTEEVTLPAAGETLTLRPVMELTERVEWEPAVGDVEGQLPAGAAARAVNGRRSQLNGCIHDYGQLDAGATGAVDLRAYVSNRGEIVGLSFQGQGLDLSRGLTHCLRRQLRSLDLPSFGGADYAVFKDQIRYTRDAGRGDAGSGGR